MTRKAPAQDPLEALAHLERMAKAAIVALHTGRATTGRGALVNIADYAGDVRRHHEEDARAAAAPHPDQLALR